MRESCTQDLYCVKSTLYTGEECARGVFAVQDIQQGALVELAHCIKLSAQEYQKFGRCSQGGRSRWKQAVFHSILLTGCSML